MTRRRYSSRDLVIRALLAAGALGMLSLVVAPWLRFDASEINSVYGRRRSSARTSVNGTSVFAEMFALRGYRVTTWNQLSPRLQRSQVIVWTPDSFELPSAEEIDYLEQKWLGLDDQRQRTLIYVARDFDAAVEFWSGQSARSQGAQRLTSQRNLAQRQSQHAYARSLTGKETTCEWFSIKSRQYFVSCEPTQGTWSADIDASAANLTVAGSLQLPATESSQLVHETLLGSTQTPFIVRITDAYRWPAGQVIVLLNGSALLNLPLVNHEHRKIAGKLIDACGAPSRATFLETGPDGPRISHQDAKAYSGFEALTVWPINSILLHLIVVGILFCIMVFPIFGRPSELENESPRDFSKHIRAVGDLLALAKDRQAALAKVRQYRHLHLEATSGRPRSIAGEATTNPGNPFKTSPDT